MKKLAVYTAIFGGKDDLKLPSPAARSSNVDFVCFTDDPTLRSDNIRIIYVPDMYPGNARLAAKIFKILPHVFLPNYESSLWLDGSFRVLAPIEPFVDELLEQHDMAFCRHWDRQCVFEEIEACSVHQRPQFEKAKSQGERYRQEGLPRHSGLMIGGILARRHTKGSNDFNTEWWKEIQRETIRDQISLGYLLWKRQPKFLAYDRSKWSSVIRFYKHVRYEQGDNRIGKVRKCNGNISPFE